VLNKYRTRLRLTASPRHAGDSIQNVEVGMGTAGFGMNSLPIGKHKMINILNFRHL